MILLPIGCRFAWRHAAGLHNAAGQAGDALPLFKDVLAAEPDWPETFEVLSVIERRGLHLSPEDRQSLDTLRRKVGQPPESGRLSAKPTD